MERKDFDEGFMELEINFKKIENRKVRDFYFQKLFHLSTQQFRHAIQSILDNEVYFPTLKTFHIFLDQYQATHPEKHRAVSCDFCDGYGCCYVGSEVYRAHCVHGQRWSTRIPLAPVEATPKPEVYVNGNFREVRKALTMLEELGIKMPKAAREKLEQMVQIQEDDYAIPF